MIDSNSSPKISPGLIWQLVDGDAVVVSPNVGKVRVLNGIGSTIWQLLAEEKEIAEIESYITTHFEVTAGQAHNDLMLFLEELKANDLITQ